MSRKTVAHVEQYRLVLLDLRNDRVVQETWLASFMVYCRLYDIHLYFDY